MDPRIKFMIEKAVENCQTEKMTAALDNLFVHLAVVPIQRAYRTKDFLERNNLKHCCCCWHRHSSSDDEE